MLCNCLRKCCCFFWTVKSFFINFSSFVTQKACDQDQVFLLDALANLFFSVVFIVKFLVYDHNMPCALEINSNSGFK